MSYRLITTSEQFATDFIENHTKKHPEADVVLNTGTAYTVKDKDGKPQNVSLEPVECKPLEKDAEGKDIPGETVEETEVFIVESDVMP